MKKLDRRGALKLAGVSILAAGSLGAVSQLQSNQNDEIKSKIVILGAGLGGISLAAKLKKDMPNADISLIDSDDTFYYQPGFTLISVGIYQKDDVIFNKSDYIPDGVEWIKNNALAIDPQNNIITLDNGLNVKYDYLVVATGVEYDFEAVKGLSLSDINSQNGNICSVYTLDGAIKTNALMENFAKNGGYALFLDQKTPMKCSGANKKIVCMSEDRLRQAGNRSKGSINLYIGGKNLFGNPVYAAALGQTMIQRDIKYTLRHQIVEIDKERNVAFFEHWMPYREDGVDKVSTEIVEVKYDWLHLPPKQKGSQILADAGLTNDGDKLNWLAVNKETLQSTKFKNIFGIGDICGFPSGKTGASIRKMYPIVAENLKNVIQGKEPILKYDGYTACPFITKYGKAIMVEFNWKGTAPSAPCFGETRESYLNWLVKLYAFKPMVMNGMLKALV